MSPSPSLGSYLPVLIPLPSSFLSTPLSLPPCLYLFTPLYMSVFTSLFPSFCPRPHLSSPLLLTASLHPFVLTSHFLPLSPYLQALTPMSLPPSPQPCPYLPDHISLSLPPCPPPSSFPICPDPSVITPQSSRFCLHAFSTPHCPHLPVLTPLS